MDEMDYVHDAECQSGPSSFEPRRAEDVEKDISFMKNYSTQTLSSSFYRKRPSETISMVFDFPMPSLFSLPYTFLKAIKIFSFFRHQKWKNC